MTAVDGRRRRFLGLRGPAALADINPRLACIPRIDPDRCNACDACVRVCGSRALILDVEMPAYRIDPARCDGCRLCVDVCDRDAIALETGTEGSPRAFALETEVCPVCGADYRTPAGAGSVRCRVCALTGVAKNRRLVRE